jgi:hypothetical protein
MGLIGTTRHSLAIVVVIATYAAIVAPALGSVPIRPAKSPALLNPKGQPGGGSPAPDGLSWDAPESCDSERFNGRAGTRRLRAYVEHWWPRVETWGYGSDPCRASLHDEGRAVDLHLDVRSGKDRRAARQLKRFFLRKDSHGEPWAMARRFGLQELIWNCHIWVSALADLGWQRYSRCDEPGATRTDKHKNHVHIGQTWLGARNQTTAYTGYEVCGACAVTDGGEPPTSVRGPFPVWAGPVTGNPVAQRP